MFIFKRFEWTFLDQGKWPITLFDYSYMEWFKLGRGYKVLVSVEPSVGGSVSGSGQYHRWDRARVEAVADSGYVFNGWTGDLQGKQALLEFEVVRNIRLQASFKPVFSPSIPTGEALESLGEVLESLDNLSPLEKQRSMAELLITGESEKAGVDLR